MKDEAISLVADFLRKKGFNPNNCQWTSGCPLTKAVWNGNLDLVDVLLRLGIDPDIRSSEKHTALHYCAIANHTIHNYMSMARLLLDHGATPDVENIHGYTPRKLALEYSRRDLADLLDQRGAKK